LLRSYKTKQVSEVDCTIWEAGRATSAASTFFDPIQIGKFREKFLDGGTGCNNPVGKVLDEALQLWPEAGRNIQMLSIGTGHPGVKEFGSGFKKIAKTLISIATETEATAKTFRSLHAPSLVTASGDKAYFRFNVPGGFEKIGLEEYKKINDIAAITKSYLTNPDILAEVVSCAGASRRRST
jgi:hypothetical protein